MIRLLCAFLITCLFAATVRAGAPQVIGSPFGYWAATVNSGTGGKYRIDVYATNDSTGFPPGSDVVFQIFGDTSERIEWIKVHNNTTVATQLIRLQVAPTGGFATMRSVDEISRATTTGEIRIDNLTLLEDLGSVTAHTIVNANVRNAYGTITLLDRGAGNSSNINTMRVNGNITGNIICQYGGILGGIIGINGLRVDGSIGTSGTPVNIWTRDDIRYLFVPTGAIFADIDVGKYSGGSSNDIGRIEARDGVTGSVKARKFADIAGSGNAPGLYITGSTGDLAANITLTQAMDRDIRVGRSFTSGNTITLPSAGLTGQIIINQQNVSGAWSGAITVGGVTLSPTPSYSNLAADIGGGAAGLAKFGLHGESSAPVNGSAFTYTPAGCPNSAILCNTDSPGGAGLVNDNRDRWALIRHYGRVSLPSGGAGAVTVERRPYGGSTWTDVSSNYVADVYTSGAGSDAGGRVLRVKRNTAVCADEYFPLNYDYRIKPVAGKVKSANVEGPPDVDA